MAKRKKFLTLTFYFFILFLLVANPLIRETIDEYTVNDPKVNEYRRNCIKRTMKKAWEAYKKDAWGYDFLAPQSHTGKNIYGLSLTIVDSLDTLLLMNMTEEFEEARDFLNTSFKMETTVSFFETTIRCLGSFITTYEQTGDKMFLDLAQKLADKLMPAFDTYYGFPRTMVNLKTGECYDHLWSNGLTLLADVGSIQLEFLALSIHTHNMTYWEKAKNVLYTITSYYDLPPVRLNYDNLLNNVKSYSLDAFGDSYYEYLLKLRLYSPENVTFIDDKFDRAIKSALKRLSFTSMDGDFHYFAQVENSKMVHEFSHLSFFLPGTLVLAYNEDPSRIDYLELAEDLKDTAQACYSSKTYLSGDSMEVRAGEGLIITDDMYKLRPEFVETLLYFWRVFKDKSDRKLAWNIYKSIEKYTSVENGYTSIHDCRSSIVVYDDEMESYFLSETLKYLYLIFCDDDVISIDDYVFNTQAHFFKKRFNMF